MMKVKVYMGHSGRCGADAFFHGMVVDADGAKVEGAPDIQVCRITRRNPGGVLLSRYDEEVRGFWLASAVNPETGIVEFQTAPAPTCADAVDSLEATLAEGRIEQSA